MSSYVTRDKALLQKNYDGPFKIISRSEKTFVVDTRGKHITVSNDRLKPVYLIKEEPHDNVTNSCKT